MTAVLPRFRAPLFTENSMADRESSSENNTRSRSVQDFVRTILHAVTNLQTQSGNLNRPENSSRAEFSSTDEEINARFQIPGQSLDRRGIPNRSATSTRVVPSTAYNPRQNYSPVRRNVSRCATLCSLSTVHSRGKKEKTKRVFCNKKRKERRKTLRRDINQKKMESMKRNIKNLSNNELTRDQITLLSRGLKFIPTPVANEDHIRRQLLNDHRTFARRMRLKYIFMAKTKSHTPSTSNQTGNHQSNHRLR